MEVEQDLSGLPRGWVWTDISCITENHDAKRTPVKDKDREKMKGPFPYYGASGIIDHVGKYIFDGEFLLVGEDGANLLSRSSPIAFIAKGQFWANNHVHVLTTYGGIPLSYLEAYFDSISLTKWITGTAQPKLTQSRMNSIPIPLAPLSEQVRIVAKLEELFARLDAGVEGLQKVKAQLKRYRQAILKYAFEGKLTEVWRRTHRDQIEPTTKLLERLREAKKDTKFKELPPIDTVDLPILPEEWTWTRIGEIAESMRNGVYKPKEFYGNNGVACLRMYNIENGAIAWKDVKRMNLTPEEIEFYELKLSDILVNRVNSRELVGKAAAIPSGLERCVYESKNIRLRLLQDYVNSKYVNFWFLMYGQKFFSRNAQQTVGMASINQEQLASMPLPLCHPNEQIIAVEEIERLFSIADKVEKTATESTEHADKMRQSILKMTFEGNLVSQDPSDEPAEKLLERIKAKKAKSMGKKDPNEKKVEPKQLELSGYVE